MNVSTLFDKSVRPLPQAENDVKHLPLWTKAKDPFLADSSPFQMSKVHSARDQLRPHSQSAHNLFSSKSSSFSDSYAVNNPRQRPSKRYCMDEDDDKEKLFETLT